MAVSLTINGIVYSFPVTGDQQWGANVTNWATAATNGLLQKAGGLFTLTNEVDFGTGFGLKSLYYKSRSSNVAATGILRLANTDAIAFRNSGNSADLLFGAGSSNAVPSYGGIDLTNLSTAQTLTNKTLSGNTAATLINGSGTFTFNSSGTITVPNATDTLVTLASSQTLSNKTFATATFTGVSTFANGLVGAPSIVFAADSTSGFYTTGGSALRASISGSNIFTINAGGVITTGTNSASVFSTTASNPAASGTIRLANADSIKFRNSGNTADISLIPGSSDSFVSYAGVDLANISTAQTLTNKTMSGSSNTFSNIADGSLSTSYIKADGSRALTANWDVGAFLVSASAFRSRSGTIASTGVLRLSNLDAIAYRNSGNSADILLGAGSSDSFIAYAGVDLANISSAQTLTNKTLSGNTAVTLISGSGTLTLNTTGTITVPNGTDTLVSLTGSQTLTNKTLTSPTLTTASMTLTTSGGTPSTFNYYEEGTFTANFNAGAGAGGSGTSGTVTFTRVGRIVTLVFPSNNSMTLGATSANLSTAASTIPSRLAPANSYIAPLPIKVNNVVQASFGALTIGSDGSLTINININASTSWTATANNGFFGFATSYSI